MEGLKWSRITVVPIPTHMAEKDKLQDNPIEVDNVTNATDVEATETETPEIKDTKYDDSVNISPEMSAPEASAAPEAVGAAESKKTGAGGEITASTLLHLLNIPNKNEFKILEKKIDLVLNRLNSLSSKIDTVVADISSGGIASALTRIDDQLLAVQHKMDDKK